MDHSLEDHIADISLRLGPVFLFLLPSLVLLRLLPTSVKFIDFLERLCPNLHARSVSKKEKRYLHRAGIVQAFYQSE